MPKVLFCASTAVHIRNFHLPYLKFFKDQGFEVHVAVPGGGAFDSADIVHDVPITKRLVSPKNIAAALKISRIIRSQHFDLILVHTTLAAYVVRLGAVFAGHNKPPLINTVHGYFFWKGCGLLRKFLYYTPERLLRRVTDCIITMNDEDYRASLKLVRRGGIAVKVPGMGVDGTRFVPPTADKKAAARRALSIPESAYVLVYAAEFSKRKNHRELITAFARICDRHPDTLLLLCGDGKLQDRIREMAATLGLKDRVRFLGWCGRMEDIYPACDLAVSTSTCEGLPFNIMEAQLCALPVVASRIRGHTDLISDGASGFLYEPGDVDELANALMGILGQNDGGKPMGERGRERVKRFVLGSAYGENTGTYLSVMKESHRSKHSSVL